MLVICQQSLLQQRLPNGSLSHTPLLRPGGRDTEAILSVFYILNNSYMCPEHQLFYKEHQLT